MQATIRAFCALQMAMVKINAGHYTLMIISSMFSHPPLRQRQNTRLQDAIALEQAGTAHLEAQVMMHANSNCELSF